MSGKKVLRFRDAEVAPVRVTIVGDWRAITPKDMLRNNVLTHFDVEAAKAVEAAREKRRREWCAGLTHVMPREFTTKAVYRQAVAERWDNFLRVEDRTHWPEHHALCWAKCEHHEKPFLMPGWHEQAMKQLRGESIWNFLEAADSRMLECPEYVALCRQAGFGQGEQLPIIQLQRPYIPKPRQTASRWAKKNWKRQQVRCQSLYGPGRKAILKALKRARKQWLYAAYAA